MTTTTTDDRIAITLPGDAPRPMHSHPVHAAGGLRMMARHLAGTIDPAIAHPYRLIQVADEAAALLADAVTLAGREQHDRELERTLRTYRELAEERAAAAGPYVVGRYGFDGTRAGYVGSIAPAGDAVSVVDDPAAAVRFPDREAARQAALRVTNATIGARFVFGAERARR